MLRERSRGVTPPDAVLHIDINIDINIGVGTA